MILEVINKVDSLIPKPVKTVLMFAGNGLIIWLFLQALLHPEMYAAWIYSSAILIFIMEFLSIHASGMSAGLATDKQKNSAFMLMCVYFIFAVAFGYFLHNWWMPFYFLLSTFIKIEEAKHYPQTDNTALLISVGIFAVSLIFVLLAAPSLPKLFPFPAEVLKAKPASASGLFVDVPQTTIVWGIVYFSIHFIIHAVFVVKESIAD